MVFSDDFNEVSGENLIGQFNPPKLALAVSEKPCSGGGAQRTQAGGKARKTVPVTQHTHF